MEISRKRKILCIFMLLLSIDHTKANIPIRRKMVGGYATFPWLNPSEDKFGNALFAPDGKSIIRIGQDSKPEYEYPLLYEERASLVQDGVMLRDLLKSDEGLYKSEDRNNPPMDNTWLFVYTEKELWPHILVDDSLLTSSSTYTILQENIKIIAQQDLQTNITLTFNDDKWYTTSCTNAPMCVYHVKTSPVPDFNTNISVSVTVDYGFYDLERNFTVYVNGTSDDVTKGGEKYLGWFMCALICLILLVGFLVWSNRRTIKIWIDKLKEVCGRRKNRTPEEKPLTMVANGPRPTDVPEIVIDIVEWKLDLQTMILEAQQADENKLSELRENFMDRYLKDLGGDDTLVDGRWNHFDCFHSRQIWELMNLLTENGPPAKPIVLDHCIGFAQFSLEKWNDEDNSDIVRNVLLVLFNLTEWKRAQDKISRTLHLQTMILEAKQADENKLAELRGNFRDRYLSDLGEDDTLGDSKWNRFDCFHSGQIWELINLLTENGPPDNPIVLNRCTGFAQLCLSKWKDNPNMVENILLVLFNLTKWERAHQISREYLELIADFLHSKSQRVSFLSCRYFVLVLLCGLYRNFDNWEQWKANIQEKMFQVMNNWKLEEQWIRKTRKKFSDIGSWLRIEKEPVIQYFALWLIKKYLYEQNVDIKLLKKDIEEDIKKDPFEKVCDSRIIEFAEEVKNQYGDALWKLKVRDW